MRLVNHHFDMNKVNIAFLLGGLLLLGTWIWAIYDDYDKAYKKYQRTFYDVYAKQLKLEKRNDWSESKQRELQQKKQELNQLKQKADARGSEISELQEELEYLNRVQYPQADKRVKSINAKLTPVEYDYQKKVVKAEENKRYEVPDPLEKRYQNLKKKYEQAVEQRARLREKRENLENKIAEKKSQISKLEGEIRQLTQKRNIIQSTINNIEDRPLNQFLDAPMINFISPRVEIKQYQVSGIYQDYNFDLVNRRDYCKSCHMGIDNPAFKLDEDGNFESETTRKAFNDMFPKEKQRERYKSVFKAHPQFDLIGPSSAKYPFSEYGCTSCHMGDGRALEFTRAAHTPDNRKERKEWKKLYNWKPRHYWGEKMLKSPFYEAGFRQFYPYGTKVDIPHADRLNEGRRLWRQNGCNNCHAVEGMNYQRKVGFSLEHIASKLDRDWVRRWVEMPTDFDPTTRMPQVFHKVNTSSPAHRELSTTVIESISVYLFEQSEPIDLDDAPPVPGDPDEGERLVKETGCTGCHSMVEEGITANEAAPDLSSVGEKVNRKWLYNWLRNPRKIWEETHMPSMKLSPEEANNITAYLMDQEKEGWDAQNFPTQLSGDTPLEDVVDSHLEEMARKFLSRTRGPQETSNELERIKSNAENSERALKLFVGEQAVEHFGCASCHAIPGHEGKNRIGANLTGWANKSTHKLAFNFIHIPHTRQDYLMTKLKNTGIFDRGLDKEYLAKYRMPKFNLTQEERRKIVTHVMSLKKKDLVDQGKQFDISSSEKIAYKGNKLVEAYNCQGCHTMDKVSGMTDYLRNYYSKKLENGESVTLGDNRNPTVRQLVKAHVPPTIRNVGNRLSQEWLFNFLKNPVGPNGRERIRTWQHVRMPNFQFSDEELTKLTEGLAHAGWDEVPPKVSAESRTSTPESRRVGRVIFQRVCSNCHIIEENETFQQPQFTPNLSYIGGKFHYEGFLDWIEKPTERFGPKESGTFRHGGMVPYSKLPMTESFLGFEPEGDYGTKKKQMQALRDYIFAQQSE